MDVHHHYVPAVPMLAPASVEDAVTALHEAGFSAADYLASSPDLQGSELDAAFHFLHWGFAERRHFLIDLHVRGLQRLRRLATADRFYIQSVVAALTFAWLGGLSQDGNDLLRDWGTIEQLRALGGVPYLVAGDESARVYARSAVRGSRFLCPIQVERALPPLASLADADIPGTEARALVDTMSTLAQSRHAAGLATIWSLGAGDVASWHRDDPGLAFDAAGFASRAAEAIEAELTFIGGAVPQGDRACHWIAGLLPPLDDASPEARVALTERYRGFNETLRGEATARGFRVLDEHDALLDWSGIVHRDYVFDSGHGLRFNERALDRILSGSIWRLVDLDPTSSGSLGDRFKTLLRELKGG